jgi:hypothetical protein
VLVDPALVAAVLGRVDGHHQRGAEAAGEMVAGRGDQPVVAVDEVEGEAVAEVDPRGEHVRVHVLDPRHELVQVARPARLAHPVDDHALHLLLGRHRLVAAREHVHVDVLGGDELLGELAHVARQPALDDGRVLPAQDQDPETHGTSRVFGEQ